MPSADSGAEFLSYLEAMGAEVLASAPGGDPATVAKALVARLVADKGGAFVYVPKRMAEQREALRRAVFDAWRKGATPKALAERFGLSEPGVYKILGVERKKPENQPQRPMFEGPW